MKNTDTNTEGYKKGKEGAQMQLKVRNKKL